MKRLALALTCAFGVSCVSHEACGPSNCGGCCSPLNDVCVVNDPHVCSPPGATCAECDEQSICDEGQCVRPPRFQGPLSLDLGSVAVGSTGSATLMFVNVGFQVLVIRDAGIVPAADITGLAVSAGASQRLRANESGSVVISFTPPSAGSFGGELIFDSNVDAGDYTPFVTGTGI